MEERINQEWHESRPFSFGGKYKSYAHYADTNKAIVDSAFSKNDVYTKYAPQRKRKYHNPTYVWRKRELFQSDVVYMNNPLMQEATGGYKYLLVVIDCFTRYLWTFPLKQITGKNVAKCLRELFQETKPEKFCSDKGKEFLNRDVEQVMDEFDVENYTANGAHKSAFAESVNKTIKKIIIERCDHFNTNNWITDEILGGAMEIYLNGFHSGIDMSPVEAEKRENQRQLRRQNYEKYVEAETHRKQAKFKVGDTVRLAVIRTKFHRNFHQNYTQETWIISKVMTNLPQPRYRVKDENGEELDDVLHENELIRYIPSGEYRIEKVLKRRVRNGRREALVRWLHYGPEHDSWEPEENLRNL